MAHKKGVGSSDNGRDSKSKRLGVKLFGGQTAKAGNILVRQRGTKFHAGENVYMGKDFTLHASVDGRVEFRKRRQNRTFVNIIPADAAVAVKPEPRPKVSPAPEVIETPVVETPAIVEEAPVVAATPEVIETPVVETPEVTEEAPVVAEATEETPKVKAPKAKAITLPSGKKVKENDLKLVEGIGPKIEELLHNAGITTWSQLAGTEPETIKSILAEGGSQFSMHDPATWPKQAQLAAEGQWEELETYQDHLKGGKE